jgi:hypothetical protein
MTETPVGSNLLEPLQILTQLVIQDVGHHLPIGNVGSKAPNSNCDFVYFIPRTCAYTPGPSSRP